MYQQFEATISTWFSDKGFGFFQYGGKKFFIHRKSFSPQVPAGSDLARKMIWVISTEQTDKGWSATSAQTFEEHNKQLEAEKQRVEAEEKNRQEILAKQESEKLRFEQNPTEVLALIGATLPISGGSGNIGGGFELLYAVSVSGENPRAEFVSADLENGPVYRVIQKVRIEINGRGWVPKIDLGVHEVVSERKGWDSMKNVWPTVMEEKLAEAKIRLRWEFKVRSCDEQLSFELEAPITFDPPKLQTRGWVKQPERVSQRWKVLQGGKEIWGKTFGLYPKVEASAQGGFEAEADALITQVKTWSALPQLTQLAGERKFEVRAEVWTFYYSEEVSEWNGRDSDELCGFTTSTRTWSERHPAVVVKYDCELLLGREDHEKGLGKTNVHSRIFDVHEDFSREGVRRQILGWVKKEIASFEFPDSDEVSKFAESLTDEILALMPLRSFAGPWVVIENHPGLKHVPHGRIMYDDKFHFVMSREDAELIGGEFEQLEGEWFTWWDHEPENPIDAPIATLLAEAWDDLFDLYENDGRYDFLNWGQRSSLQNFVEEQQGKKFAELPVEDQWGLRDAFLAKVAEYDALMDSLDPLIERHRAGEIYLQLEVYCEGGWSGGYVLRADGTEREADRNYCRPRKAEGRYEWDFVDGEAGEMYFSWKKESKRDEHPEVESFIPKAGLTLAQCEKIAEVEKTYGINIASKL